MASRSQGGQQPKAGFPNSELGRDGKTSQQADGVERDMSRALALTAIALAVLLFSGTAVESRGQTSCSFKAGFKTLRDQIPQVVGDCLEDEHVNPDTGDTEQRTTGGLLVWRAVDGWTSFTDGQKTWIDGPQGLQSRPKNSQLDWEKQVIAAQAIPKSQASSQSTTAPLTSSALVPPPPEPGIKIRPLVGQFLDAPLRDALALLLANPLKFSLGKRIGPFYEEVLNIFRPDVVVGKSGSGLDSNYFPASRRIVIGEDYLNEDPRVLTAVLAHELMHARQDYVNRFQGFFGRECVLAEMEAYGAQAEVWATFWGGKQGPSRTTVEGFSNYLLQIVQTSGGDGLSAMIENEPTYQRFCHL